MKDEEMNIIAIGVFGINVCVPKDWTIEHVCNEIAKTYPATPNNPTGWQAKKIVPCEQNCCRKHIAFVF